MQSKEIINNMNAYKISFNEYSGYSIFKKTPMNNFPNCELFFWQQVSPYYWRKGNLLNWAKKNNVSI